MQIVSTGRCTIPTRRSQKREPVSELARLPGEKASTNCRSKVDNFLRHIQSVPLDCRRAGRSRSKKYRFGMQLMSAFAPFAAVAAAVALGSCPPKKTDSVVHRGSSQ